MTKKLNKKKAVLKRTGSAKAKAGPKAAVRKTSGKMARKKQVRAKKPIAGVATAKHPEFMKRTALAVETPARSPIRRMLGPGNKVTVLQSSVGVNTSPSVMREQGITPIRQVAPDPPKMTAPPLPARKFAWTELPKTFPAHIKVLVNTSKIECANAATWPFPFAKFIASLPEEMCGMEFALLLLSLEHGTGRIAALCGIKIESVEAALQSARTNLLRKFESTCDEMWRKWRTRHVAVNMDVDALIEQYLISGVDRNFQNMLGAMIFGAMGVRLSADRQTPAWSEALAAAEI